MNWKRAPFIRQLIKHDQRKFGAQNHCYLKSATMWSDKTWNKETCLKTWKRNGINDTHVISLVHRDLLSSIKTLSWGSHTSSTGMPSRSTDIHKDFNRVSINPSFCNLLLLSRSSTPRNCARVRRSRWGWGGPNGLPPTWKTCRKWKG